MGLSMVPSVLDLHQVANTLTPSEIRQGDQVVNGSKKKGSEPYVQSELFQADRVEWPVKDDLASMEFPIFSLKKAHDTAIREYENPSTKKRIRITPSVVGAATVFDKDLLLFIGSQLIEARKEGQPISRKVKVDIYRFLTGTCRSQAVERHQPRNKHPDWWCRAG
jgi:plasmid replication initiation protein